MPNNEKMPVQNFDNNSEELAAEKEEQVPNETENRHARIDALKGMGYVPLSLEATGSQTLDDSDIDVVHGWLTDPQIPEDAKKKFLEQRSAYVNGEGQEDPLQAYLLWDPKTNSFYKMDRI